MMPTWIGSLVQMYFLIDNAKRQIFQYDTKSQELDLLPNNKFSPTAVTASLRHTQEGNDLIVDRRSLHVTITSRIYPNNLTTVWDGDCQSCAAS